MQSCYVIQAKIYCYILRPLEQMSLIGDTEIYQGAQGHGFIIISKIMENILINGTLIQPITKKKDKNGLHVGFESKYGVCDIEHKFDHHSKNKTLSQVKDTRVYVDPAKKGASQRV